MTNWNRIKQIEKLNNVELSTNAPLDASWHNRYSDSAYIYIGNLSYELNEGDIIQVFSQFGEIVDCNLVRDKESNESKGYCFIAYEDQLSTILAVDNMNGSKLLERILNVDHVLQYRKPKHFNKNNKNKNDYGYISEDDETYESRRKKIWDYQKYTNNGVNNNNNNNKLLNQNIKTKVEKKLKLKEENDMNITLKQLQLEKKIKERKEKRQMQRIKNELLESINSKNKDNNNKLLNINDIKDINLNLNNRNNNNKIDFNNLNIDQMKIKLQEYQNYEQNKEKEKKLKFIEEQKHILKQEKQLQKRKRKGYLDETLKKLYKKHKKKQKKKRKRSDDSIFSSQSKKRRII